MRWQVEGSDLLNGRYTSHLNAFTRDATLTQLKWTEQNRIFNVTTATATHSLRRSNTPYITFYFSIQFIFFPTDTVSLLSHCSVECLFACWFARLLALARSLFLHIFPFTQANAHTNNDGEGEAHTQCLLVKTIFMTSAHSINVLHLPFSCSLCVCVYTVDVLICLSKWKGKSCCCAPFLRCCCCSCVLLCSAVAAVAVFSYPYACRVSVRIWNGISLFVHYP